MSEIHPSSAAPSLPPNVTLLHLITGRWISQMIYAAAKLGIADLLTEGGKSVEELASATQTHPRSLFRLLRSLAAVGVFTESKPHFFELTPLASCLRSDSPDSMRAMAIMFGEEFHYKAWGNILHSIRTGETAMKLTHGKEFFDFLLDHAEIASLFDQAMTSVSTLAIHAVTSAYDFTSIGTLVDIGGGHGSLLTTVLKANPHLHGILFDQPFVVEHAKNLVAEAGMEDRCARVGGNFFESVPAGGDAYMMKYIIHDWDDQPATTILKNIHRAMNPRGKVLVVETLVSPGDEPGLAKLLDMEMLVMSSGRERTVEEYAALFEASGFKLNRVIPTQSPMSILEAVQTSEG